MKLKSSHSNPKALTGDERMDDAEDSECTESKAKEVVPEGQMGLGI